MLIEEIITKEAWPILGTLGRAGIGRAVRGLGRGARATGRWGTRLSRFLSFDPEAKKIHDDMEASEDEQERERLRLELEQRIKHWEDEMDLLYGKGWGESVNERELTKIIEKTPPGREDQVKALKKKWPNDLERVYATAWASYNKRKK